MTQEIGQKTGLNRRDFMVVTAAASTVSAGAASAAPAADAPVIATNWARATPAEMETLIGQRFRVTAPDGASGVLELVDVEPVISGPDRPDHLPRAEGVVAVFDSPDKDFFVGAEQAVHRVSHARLGTADLFLGRHPTRSGGDLIELVLN